MFGVEFEGVFIKKDNKWLENLFIKEVLKGNKTRKRKLLECICWYKKGLLDYYELWDCLGIGDYKKKEEKIIRKIDYYSRDVFLEKDVEKKVGFVFHCFIDGLIRNYIKYFGYAFDVLYIKKEKKVFWPKDTKIIFKNPDLFKRYKNEKSYLYLEGKEEYYLFEKNFNHPIQLIVGEENLKEFLLQEKRGEIYRQ